MLRRPGKGFSLCLAGNLALHHRQSGDFHQRFTTVIGENVEVRWQVILEIHGDAALAKSNDRRHWPSVAFCDAPTASLMFLYIGTYHM